MITRRAVVYYISNLTLLDIFDGFRTRKYEIPVFKDLPQDARLDCCWYEMGKDAFGVRFEHPSFPVVPLDEMPEVRGVEIKHIDMSRSRLVINEEIIPKTSALTEQPPTSIKPCWTNTNILKSKIEQFLVKHGNSAWSLETLKEKAVSILVTMLQEEHHA